MLSLANRHLVQPLVAWKAKSPHLKYLRTLERTQNDPPEVIRDRQLAAVRAMVRHAWETVPFWRHRWRELGLHPDALESLDDLRQFPILAKADLRAHGGRLRSSACDDRSLSSKTTSGSTGVPLTVVVDQDAMAWKRAGTIRSDQWSGWRLGMRVARLWGHGAAERGGWKARLRRHFVDRESFLNTLGIDRPRLRAFADHLRRNAPGLLFGHAHSLYLFAAYVRKYCPGTVRPVGVVSAAMTLHDWQRAVIERAFGRPVTNRYGCEEVSLIACECEEHRGLHLNADSVYCEVVPDDRLSAGPNAGRLLITDLTNRAMPLIRYQVGDVVIPSDRTCRCGRGLPLIEQVVGREADYVLTPTGTLISGISLTDHFATEIRGAAQVQIVQEKLRFLRLRMVAGEGFGPDSHGQIETLVRNTFGTDMGYEVELVDAIPQEPSGKYRFCVSPVATAYLKSLAP
ncbi:MAG TPA: phenylacetate--CoA ligase family protein [Gemmataceae bacterium]|nr:phenylacetate--CoA ligase family protein [Gemmataceae bacterium]